MTAHRIRRRVTLALAFVCLGGSTAGCSSDASSSQSEPASVALAMHGSLLLDIQSLEQAANELSASAPAESDTGWSAEADPAAVQTMKANWQAARTAYERCEGALAPIFPDIDFSLDARYDDFVSEMTRADDDLFDGEGVTGLHAIERILYSDSIPERVTAFESTLPFYEPAQFPRSLAESGQFISGLCARLQSDAHTLEAQWTPAKIDIAAAFGGLVSLMNEQREKVNKASTNQEESRYSQRTMSDIRDNLAGTREIYELFRPWLLSKANASDAAQDGPTLDAAIEAGFDQLKALYEQVPGDAIPAPPATWSAESPSSADLETPFGQLYSGVRAAVDPDSAGSVVSNMRQAASVLGLTLAPI